MLPKQKLQICLEFWEKLAIYIIFNTVAIFISILIWKLNNFGATLFPPGGLSVIIINNNYCWNIHKWQKGKDERLIQIPRALLYFEDNILFFLRSVVLFYECFIRLNKKVTPGQSFFQ